jgi:hypothetical protein
VFTDQRSISVTTLGRRQSLHSIPLAFPQSRSPNANRVAPPRANHGYSIVPQFLAVPAIAWHNYNHDIVANITYSTARYTISRKETVPLNDSFAQTPGTNHAHWH